MAYSTLLINVANNIVTVTLNRLSQKNSINFTMLKEINEILDKVENDPRYNIVVLENNGGIFSSGMDFVEIQDVNDNLFFETYMNTLKRFSLSSKIIICKINGKVLAGGVGLVSASDIVLASPKSEFVLSEALWGLLPAMVMPYLIRRVGFQKAYIMTLTTISISAKEAQNYNLVDEVTDNLEESLQKFYIRLERIKPKTVKIIKNYFRNMWIITNELEQTAVHEISRLSKDSENIKGIQDFIKYRKFPWENIISERGY